MLEEKYKIIIKRHILEFLQVLSMKWGGSGGGGGNKKYRNFLHVIKVMKGTSSLKLYRMGVYTLMRYLYA